MGEAKLQVFYGIRSSPRSLRFDGTAQLTSITSVCHETSSKTKVSVRKKAREAVKGRKSPQSEEAQHNFHQGNQKKKRSVNHVGPKCLLHRCECWWMVQAAAATCMGSFIDAPWSSMKKSSELGFLKKSEGLHGHFFWGQKCWADVTTCFHDQAKASELCKVS